MLFKINLKKKKTKIKGMAIFGSCTKQIALKSIKTVFNTGRMLAENNITLVYGVGDDGMMGAAYRGARSAGGRVFGVTTKLLLERQCKDPSMYGEGELKIVNTLEERKVEQLKAADALLIAPGGWGTMDEIATFGVHFKIGDWKPVPIIFLNYGHYWDGFLKFFKQMKKDKAVTSKQIAFIGSVRSPKKILKEYERIKKSIDESFGNE